MLSQAYGAKINYDEIYYLKGKLLTLVDATFQDQEQRKAHKQLVWNAVRDWYDDCERSYPITESYKPLPGTQVN